MKIKKVSDNRKWKLIDFNELSELDKKMEEVNDKYHNSMQTTLQEANNIFID